MKQASKLSLNMIYSRIKEHTKFSHNIRKIIIIPFNEMEMIQIWTQHFPYKSGIVTLNKSVINYIPRCTYQ